MSTLDFTEELAWQDPQISGHGIIHAALNDTEFGEADAPDLTVRETAMFLGLTEKEILELIDQQILCASIDENSGDYIINRACAKAQQSSYMKTRREIATTAGALNDLFSMDGLGPKPGSERAAHQGVSDTAAEQADSEPEEPIDSLTGLPPIRPKALTEDERSQITTKNAEALINSLDFANVRLEGAMYRVGYLEAQVESLQEQMKVLPDLRTRSARALITDRENDLLKEAITAQQLEVEKAQAFVEKVRSNQLLKFFLWAFGLSLPE